MSRKFAVAMLLMWAGCMGDAQPSEDLDLSSAVQELQTCTNSCAWPQYNGVPVSCSTNTYCLSTGQGVFCDGGVTVLCSACGNGTCESGESSSNCLADCSVCGDGQCTGSENGYSCPSDCTVCGDGICQSGEEGWCTNDCSTCGDGLCSPDEYYYCPWDCCGGRFCNEIPYLP